MEIVSLSHGGTGACGQAVSDIQQLAKIPVRYPGKVHAGRKAEKPVGSGEKREGRRHHWAPGKAKPTELCHDSKAEFSRKRTQSSPLKK
jgi:hypothetical protein